MELGRKITIRRSGDEPLRNGSNALGSTLLDFWRWSSSDLVDNAHRGVFAEFLVAMAIGAPLDGVRENWTPVDVQSAEGIKIEVKSAAYFQSWAQKRPSPIRFGVPKKLGWDHEAGAWEQEARRHADVYVFALLAHQDKATLDPIDVSQWEFYALSTSLLEASAVRTSISLATLRALTQAVRFDGLRDAVLKSARDGSE